MATLPFAACLIGLSCLTPAHPPASIFQLTSHDTANRIASVVLTCEPTGGTHPKRDKACDVLPRVDGDFTRIQARPQACNLIYAPVDVAVAGSWRGRPVAFKTTYPNRCAANRDSDDVFAF